MKFHPTTPGNPQREKTKFNKYNVVINGYDYQTSALTSKAALSKASFRYANDVGEEVGLIQWKLREGKLSHDVVEI